MPSCHNNSAYTTSSKMRTVFSLASALALIQAVTAQVPTVRSTSVPDESNVHYNQLTKDNENRPITWTSPFRATPSSVLKT